MSCPVSAHISRQSNVLRQMNCHGCTMQACAKHSLQAAEGSLLCAGSNLLLYALCMGTLSGTLQRPDLDDLHEVSVPTVKQCSGVPAHPVVICRALQHCVLLVIHGAVWKNATAHHAICHVCLGHGNLVLVRQTCNLCCRLAICSALKLARTVRGRGRGSSGHRAN